jgi:hypothetical protein
MNTFNISIVFTTNIMQDVLSHKGMGKNQVEALVQHAKELDTRFDKGSVQRSFL